MKFCKTYHDLFDHYLPSGKRICLNQGGTRSGKTFSTLQFIIETAIRGAELHMEGIRISVVRKTFPSLKRSAYRDFTDILKKLQLYSEVNHNRSDHEYHLGNSTIEFFSTDDSMKLRGSERDLLFVNEANELSLEEWRQLTLRTKSKIIADFNPSDEFHWLYDEVMTQDECLTFISTYKDNPFLKEGQVYEIERYKEVDENYWRVFGLGERGVSGSTIFTHWKMVDEVPAGGEREFGLDFGFNNPCALIECTKHDKGEKHEAGVYLDEFLYQSHLTNNDLISRMKDMPIGRKRIKCDHEPDRIEELNRAGFNAVAGKKDVKVGIDKLKSVPLFVTKRSVNLIRELKSYKWKVDSMGRTMEEPVKINDHGCDASRMGSYDLIADRKTKPARYTFA